MYRHLKEVSLSVISRTPQTLWAILAKRSEVDNPVLGDVAATNFDLFLT
jgi:hypothetical protein